MLVFLNIAPIFVTFESSGVLNTKSSGMPSAHVYEVLIDYIWVVFIDRNLRIWNGWFNRPVLICLNNKGGPENTNKKRAIIGYKGTKISNNKKEIQTSKQRLPNFS